MGRIIKKMWNNFLNNLKMFTTFMPQQIMFVTSFNDFEHSLQQPN